MTNNKLLKLLSVKVNHDFYSNGSCPDFRLIPSAKCKMLLSRYKMFLRELNNGIEIHYLADEQSNPIVKLSDEERFIFYMQLKNKLLYNISALPSNSIHSNVFFLTNKQQADPDSSTLHSSSTSVNNDDYIELKPQRFTIEEDSSSKTAKYVLSNIYGDSIKQNNPIVELKDKEAPADPDEYQIIYNVDLENQLPGKYELSLNGSEYKTFYSDNIAYRNKSFGVVEIYKQNNTEKEYQIIFLKKNCYWKYIIVPKYQTDITISKLQIDSTKSFKDVSSQTLTDGTSVGIIESEDEIGFSEKPVNDIKLQLKGSGNQVSTLIDNLPNPNPANIKIDQNTNKVYSEVFVYI